MNSSAYSYQQWMSNLPPHLAPPKKQIGFIGLGSPSEAPFAPTEQSLAMDLGTITNLSKNYPSDPRFSALDITCYYSYEELLAHRPDGAVIATPWEYHSAQSINALTNGIAVFCHQLPGHNHAELAEVVSVARKSNLLLGLDLPYRFTCYQLLHHMILSGELGKINSIELVFNYKKSIDLHDNCTEGCLSRLGIHLLDLAMWSLNYPDLEVIKSILLPDIKGVKEDYAFALLKTSDSIPISLTCSWDTSANSTSTIQVTVNGSEADATFRNTNGSCHDFEIVKFIGDKTEVLFNGADDWEGRPLIDWSQRMIAGNEYDSKIESVLKVVKMIDKIYTTHTYNSCS